MLLMKKTDYYLFVCTKISKCFQGSINGSIALERENEILALSNFVKIELKAIECK